MKKVSIGIIVGILGGFNMNDIELFLNQQKTKSSQELIYEYIDRFFQIKNLSPKDSYIYNKANIDRRLFSKFRYGNYHLSKNNLLKLCIALELDIQETNEVLGSAGYVLSTNQEFDLILRYFIINRDYNLSKINEQLYSMTENDLT